MNLFLLAALAFVPLLVGCAAHARRGEAQVPPPEAVLDAFHDAAARADGPAYFGLLTEDAVFLGTDASERWTKDQFRAYAEPYFNQGKGWTYTPRERHVGYAPGGATAWFDELLWNEKYGVCRGSGVLVRTGGGWRIAQYNLSVPVPNDLLPEFAERIRAHGSEGK